MLRFKKAGQTVLHGNQGIQVQTYMKIKIIKMVLAQIQENIETNSGQKNPRNVNRLVKNSLKPPLKFLRGSSKRNLSIY